MTGSGMADGVIKDCAPTVCSSRRQLLAGVTAAGAIVLSGCAVYDSSAPPANNAGDPAGDPAAGQVLARAADIPVGGGAIIAGQGLVITQPQAGTFRAFSATCTHQGCAVTEVADGTINCPCHGSRFSVTDGSVAGGPAKRSLDSRALVVEDGDIRLA